MIRSYSIFSDTTEQFYDDDHENIANNGHRQISCSYGAKFFYKWLFKNYVYFLPMHLLLFSSALCKGAELDIFRLTGLAGSVELGYSVEDLEVNRVNGTTTNQRRLTSEQKLEIDTQSYFYHPNLLEMTLGVGVEFKDEETETSSVTFENKQTLYSVNSEFDILKEKPYPIRLYYNQYNPTSSVGLADTVTHENKDYGILLSLRDPIVTFPVFLRANHAESKGEGGGTSIDSDYDYQDIRILTSGLENITAQLTIDHSRKRSGSGSINLPIQTTLNEKFGVDFSSNIKFGEDSRHTLFNKLTYDIDEFKEQTKTEDARFYASLNMEHSETFKSHYTYNFDQTRNEDSDTESTNQDLTAGILKEITENLSFSGNLDVTDEKTQGFDNNSHGFRSFLRYKSDISDHLGFNTSYLIKYMLYEQASEVDYVSTTGETHIVEDLQPLYLANTFVIDGSVLVSNQDRTQTYSEGIDYELTEIGYETRVVRLLGGNIADGEVLLIDYRYETGGTYSYDQLNQILNFGFSLFNNYRISMGFSKQEESLEEGRPIRPLYTTETAYVAADASHRLARSIGLTWRLAAEREKGELRPYKRKEADLNLSTALPLVNGFANLHARYENVDNELTDEDIDLSLYGINLFIRTGFRSRVSLKYSVENDTGSTLPREVRRSQLNYIWRRRLLSFRLKGEYDLEEQGDAFREDSAIYITLRRDF